MGGSVCGGGVGEGEEVEGYPPCREALGVFDYHHKTRG